MKGEVESNLLVKFGFVFGHQIWMLVHRMMRGITVPAPSAATHTISRRKVYTIDYRRVLLSSSGDERSFRSNFHVRAFDIVFQSKGTLQSRSDARRIHVAGLVLNKSIVMKVTSSLKLASGQEMPIVGFGLWKVPAESAADTVYNVRSTRLKMSWYSQD